MTDALANENDKFIFERVRDRYEYEHDSKHCIEKFKNWLNNKKNRKVSYPVNTSKP